MQAKYYNSKHQPCKYNIRDFVYFNSWNIESTRLFKKLDWKFYGLYKMIEPIGKQAYKLKLSQIMKMYNVFHISLLKLGDRVYKGNVLPPPPINIKSKDKYEIKKIFDSKSYYGKL